MATPEEEDLKAKSGRPDYEFPGVHFPTIFADGVASHVDANGISKFYLYRTDPNMFGRGGIVFTPTVQVNMPTRGFLDMTAFFYQRIQQLIKAGRLTQENWDSAVQGQSAAATTSADAAD